MNLYSFAEYSEFFSIKFLASSHLFLIHYTLLVLSSNFGLISLVHEEYQVKPQFQGTYQYVQLIE